MVLSFLVNGVPDLLAYVREAPEATHAALAALQETLSDYAQAALEQGADGIFFAVKAADGDQLTRAQYAEFGLPYDRPVLDAAAGGWLNLLHLCGDHLYFEVAGDLPSPLISWALSPDNPSLAAGRTRARRAVIGGVSPKPQIREMTPAQVAAEVDAALADTRGVQMMIGPGCSVSPDTPEANLDAAIHALAAWVANSELGV
jgi:uroporphyrinogen decarboxylase